MTVLTRPPRARRAVAVGRGVGERDQLGRVPRDLWEALAADSDYPANSPLKASALTPPIR